MAYNNLSNDEIRQKLLNLKIPCGPVTDATRSVYLKKLNNLLNNVKAELVDDPDLYSDDQLRAALKLYNISVGPIVSDAVRQMFMHKLKALRKEGEPSPMDVETNFAPFESDEEDL